MRVTPTGQSEFQGGNEVGRYGRDIPAGVNAFVWYHNGLHVVDEPAWAMDMDVGDALSVSLDAILVADENNGLYRVDADKFRNNTMTIDGREQYVAQASDPHVEALGDPNDHLRGNLWLTADNSHGGYHKDKNEA